MSDSLRTVLTQAIYDAPNGIDGDQLADMLMEDFRITGKTPEECRAQIVAVCQSVADAALAAIEASGTHIVYPVEARLRSYWHEDMGPQLWWIFPIAEPPYCGSPLDNDWPDYHTHFTPIPLAARPRDAAPTDKEV